MDASGNNTVRYVITIICVSIVYIILGCTYLNIEYHNNLHKNGLVYHQAYGMSHRYIYERMANLPVIKESKVGSTPAR